jgi:flagella basal body P-ring formation protein FlgA
MIDRRTRTTVSTGDVVLPSMLEPEAIVARGSDIMLRSTVDGHEFNFLVECTEDGCLGDLVECRTRSGRSMKARVIAPNMAEINPAL